MKIQTTRFGEIEIGEDKLLDFASGIPGFSDLTKFVILEYKDPVSWLQSTENPEVAFIISDPFQLFPAYSLKLSDDVLKFLNITDSSEALVFVILSVSDSVLSANLRAPILVNTKSRMAAQLIVDDERLSFKTPVPAVNKK
ncbi:MAG: flagellar assembly protein FliW [Nitrospiraceae bacterium]|nr:flagellar assembly protein FliW [Nitrospiraceae bacterium]